MDTAFAYGGIATGSDTARRGIGLLRWLVRVNLGLVALQALSAGFVLSGYAHAVAMHTGVAMALELVALAQAVTAVVLWRRRRVPGSVARVSIGLFVILLLQFGLGHNKLYWLHVPLGVGIFGGLTRQSINVDTLWREAGVRQ